MVWFSDLMLSKLCPKRFRAGLKSENFDSKYNSDKVATQYKMQNSPVFYIMGSIPSPIVIF